jgi:hypothetical protein
VVGDELKTPKANGFAKGESTACRRSPSSVTESADDGTIETSRVKARYKSPYQVRQLSMFFAPARYSVVKITCSSFEMVL